MPTAPNNQLTLPARVVQVSCLRSYICWSNCLKGQVQGQGWFLTRFPLKLTENDAVGETVKQWCTKKEEEKKAFSVVLRATPWRPNHVTICLLRHSGESLQNGQLELRRRYWYFARETHKDTAVSVWACQAGFWKSTGTSCQLRSKPHAVFHGVCEIALTEVLATQMGVMRRSKKVSSFELYKLNPLSPHCGSIARELVHCYT